MHRPYGPRCRLIHSSCCQHWLKPNQSDRLLYIRPLMPLADLGNVAPAGPPPLWLIGNLLGANMPWRGLWQCHPCFLVTTACQSLFHIETIESALCSECAVVWPCNGAQSGHHDHAGLMRKERPQALQEWAQVYGPIFKFFQVFTSYTYVSGTPIHNFIFTIT